jgi:hypothetical protein
MSLIFEGEFKTLAKYAARIDPDGEWRSLMYRCHQYRTANGAVMCWWEKSGKIAFQGNGVSARDFERSFIDYARDKRRLSEEPKGRTLDLGNDRDFIIQWVVAQLRKDNDLLRRVRKIVLNHCRRGIARR